MRPIRSKPCLFIIKLLSFLPACLLLGLIFGFSAQTGEESGSLSFQISLFLVKLVSPLFPAALSNELLMERAEAIHFLVRKAAHMTEYFLLALSLQLPLFVCFKDRLPFKKRLLFGTLAAMFFAFLDEFHQLFVDGRSGSLTDVGIDTIGIFAAAIFFYLLSFCKRKRMKP